MQASLNPTALAGVLACKDKYKTLLFVAGEDACNGGEILQAGTTGTAGNH